MGEGCGGGQRIALSTGAPGAPQAHRPHVHGLPGAQRPAPPRPAIFFLPGSGFRGRRGRPSKLPEDQVLRFLGAPSLDASLQCSQLRLARVSNGMDAPTQ